MSETLVMIVCLISYAIGLAIGYFIRSLKP